MTWAAISGGEITLGASGADLIRDIEADVQAISGLDSVSVSQFQGDAFRFTNTDRIYTQAEHILPMPRREMTRAGILLPHYDSSIANNPMGLDENQLEDELAGSASEVAALTGAACVSFSWPNHYHSKRLMRRLRDSGYTAARNGPPHTAGEPDAGWIINADQTHVDWVRTWAKCPLYALPTPDYTSTNSLVGAIAYTDHATVGTRSMDSLLNDTETWNTNNAAHAIRLYGVQTNLLDMWAYYHTLAILAPHGTSADPTDEQIGWLLGLLIADGRVWISDLATIGAYAAASHAETGVSLVWEPTSGNEADDGSGTPWSGEASAFCLCMDLDGQTGSMTKALAYADVFTATSTRMTACLKTSEVGDAYTEANIIALQAKGCVDVGSHSVNGTYLLSRACCSLKNTGSTRLAVEVTSAAEGSRKLKFYQLAGAAAWYADIAALTDFGGISQASDLDALADSDPIDSWAEAVGALTGTETTTNRPTLVKNAINTSMSAVAFDRTASQGLSYGTTAATQLFSNTNGLTVFLVARHIGAGNNDWILGKWQGTATNREWSVAGDYHWMSEDGTSTGQSSGLSLIGADESWHIYLLTWIPGAAPRWFKDGYTSPASTGSAAITDMITNSSITLTIGYRHGRSEPWTGEVACWGHVAYGYANAHASLGIIYNTLKSRYGL